MLLHAIVCLRSGLELCKCCPTLIKCLELEVEVGHNTSSKSDSCLQKIKVLHRFEQLVCTLWCSIPGWMSWSRNKSQHMKAQTIVHLDNIFIISYLNKTENWKPRLKQTKGEGEGSNQPAVGHRIRSTPLTVWSKN